ncbi:MAG: DUF4136 domain-containing protein [Reichenbachiella sp.]
MKNTLWAIYGGLLFILVGCYPGDVITNEETDIVITHHLEEPDFSAYRTYAMPDSLIEDPDEDDEIIIFEDEIMEAIETNMTNLGYTRIDHTDPNAAEPDLVLLPQRLIINHYATGGCYYCWGWNPWYPGYPGYYPPYPPTYVISYQSGSIIMTLIETNTNLPAEELPDAVWTGAINGILRSSLAAERVVNLIDQAFDQSPYLNVN